LNAEPVMSASGQKRIVSWSFFVVRSKPASFLAT
jgi:hypothetical protein